MFMINLLCCVIYTATIISYSIDICLVESQILIFDSQRGPLSLINLVIKAIINTYVKQVIL